MGASIAENKNPPPLVLTPAAGAVYNPFMPPQTPNYSRYRIDFLYHITHVDNMPSIREHGLLSHNAAQQAGLVSVDISDPNVQERRADKSVFGRPLHDYVPLYFNPKNPMLSVRRERQDNLVILFLDRELLVQDGVVFSDGNAASGPTNFFNDVSRLADLDWACIQEGYWNDYEDGTRIRCAEVLVPEAIPFTKIQSIRVRTAQTREHFDNLMREARSGQRPPPVGVASGLFFDD